MAADKTHHACVGWRMKLTGKKLSILANMDGRTRTRSGVFQLSSAQYSIWAKPSWHYFALFRLLQLSTSYWAVHSVKSLGSNPGILAPIGGVERVEEVYGHLGEVWDTPFWDWWFAKAQYVFGVSHSPHVRKLGHSRKHTGLAQEDLEKLLGSVATYFRHNGAVEGHPETLLLAVPVYADKNKVLAEISAMIEEASEQNFVAPAKLKILRRKFRRQTINAAIRVAQARAYHLDVPLSRLGEIAKIKAGWASDPKKHAGDPAEAQREFAIYTSRYLRRAWLYSENAARGSFFSNDPMPSGTDWPKMEFSALRERLDTYATVSRTVYSQLEPHDISSERRYAGRNRTLFPADPPL